MEVLQNDHNEILANSDGDALGPNYNFGKSLIDIYFEVDSNIFNGANYFSYEMFLLAKGYNVLNRMKYGVGIKYSDGSFSRADYYMLSDANYVQIRGNNLNGTRAWAEMDPVAPTNYPTNNLLYWYGSINKIGVNVENNVFGATYISYTGGYYVNDVCRIALLRLYNRYLTLAERNHNKNNLLGNEPYRTNGLLGEYKFNLAEILNFKDVQNACVRDELGQNHARLINLPAGTLQEKVDYVNNNKMINFIA